jgi:hypothetical protein
LALPTGFYHRKNIKTGVEPVRFSVLMALLMAMQNSYADYVQQCTDSKGKITFSNTGCAEKEKVKGGDRQSQYRG